MLHLEPRADAARFFLRDAAAPRLGDPRCQAPDRGHAGWVVAS